MKRRLLSAVLALCVLCCLAPPARADMPGIAVRAVPDDGGTAYPNGTVTVPIYVDIPSGGSLTGIGLVISYPGSALKLTGAKLETTKLIAALKDPATEVPMVGEGREDECQYIIAAAGASEIKGQRTMKLATLTFQVQADAAPGEYTVTLARYGGNNGGENYAGYTYTWDKTLNDGSGGWTGLEVVFTGAAITVPEPTIEATASGSAFDLTLHGTVNEGDRLLAALYSAGGQMKDLTVMSAAAELSGVGFKKTVDAEDIVKFMWVSSGWLPRCAALRWSQS